VLISSRRVNAPTSRVLVLGPIEVTTASGSVAIREGMSRRLLAALVIRAPMPVPADVLIDELWDDRQPTDARNALQVLISHLRRSLEPLGDGISIERSGSSYRLVLSPPAELDAELFEEAVRQLPETFTLDQLPEAAEAALGRADDALALWRGPPYVDAMYDEFAQVEITRLRELHATAHERRAQALLALRRNADAVEALQRLVDEHPLRESVWSSLILALYRSRRQAEALRAYATAREQLIDELGVEPGPDLRELERRVLDQDPVLDVEPPVVPVPKKGSRTVSPGFVDAIRMRCRSASGFCVGCALRPPSSFRRSGPEQIGNSQSERICRSSFEALRLS